MKFLEVAFREVAGSLEASVMDGAPPGKERPQR